MDKRKGRVSKPWIIRLEDELGQEELVRGGLLSACQQPITGDNGPAAPVTEQTEQSTVTQEAIKLGPMETRTEQYQYVCYAGVFLYTQGKEIFARDRQASRVAGKPVPWVEKADPALIPFGFSLWDKGCTSMTKELRSYWGALLDETSGCWNSGTKHMHALMFKFCYFVFLKPSCIFQPVSLIFFI